MRRDRALLSYRSVIAVVAALLSASCAPAPTPAGSSVAPAGAAKPAAAGPQAVEEFYRGKNIIIVVGTTAGGGFDTDRKSVV